MMMVFFYVFSAGMAGMALCCAYLLLTVGPCFSEPGDRGDSHPSLSTDSAPEDSP